MFDFLDKLRQKPEHVRRKIAYGAVAVLMLPVVGVWAGTMHAQFTTPAEEQAVYDKNTPVSALLQTSSVFWSGVKESFGQAKSQVELGLDQFKESQQSSGSSSVASSLTATSTMEGEKFEAATQATGTSSSSATGAVVASSTTATSTKVATSTLQ